MKRACFSVLIAYCFAASLSAQAAGDRSLQFARDLAALAAMSPRNEGSQAEAKAVGYLEQRLAAMGVASTRRELTDVEGEHSFSTSIEVLIKGARPDELLVASSIDAPLGARSGQDGSVDVALELGMIESLARSTPPISIRFLFLGAEHGSGAEYPFGTTEFLGGFYPDYPVAVLYLAYRALPDRTLITAGGTRAVSPYWLVERTANALGAGGLDYLLRGNETQIYRLGLLSSPPLIEPYLQANYPAIELSELGARSPTIDARAWFDSWMRSFGRFVELNARGFPTTWDRHYLFFQSRGFTLIMTEQQYVVLLIIVFALALLYPVVYKERFVRYLGAIWKHFLHIPLLFAVTFGFLVAGTFLVEGIALIRGFPTIWQHAPFAFFALKIVTALFLFAMLFKLLRRLPFAESGRFYTATALLLLIVDIALIGSSDISLTYYLVWAFLCTFVFSIVRPTAIKILLFAASTALLVKGAVDIFTLPAMEVIRVALLSQVRGNLIIAANLLPFVLLLIRLEFLIRRSIRRFQFAVIQVTDVALGLALVILVVYLSTFAPFGPNNPQPITVRERMDLATATRRFEITSPAPIGRVTLHADGATREISTRARRYELTLSGVPEPVRLDERSSAFLDRSQFDLTLDPIGLPYEIVITLAAPKELVVYDSNFPYTYNARGDQATIHIGKNPPVPLDVEFTLPQGAGVEMALRVVYTSSPYPLGLTGKNIDATSELEVDGRYPVTE